MEQRLSRRRVLCVVLGALVRRAAARVRSREGLVTLAELVEELRAVEYASPFTYRRVVGEPADA